MCSTVLHVTCQQSTFTNGFVDDGGATGWWSRWPLVIITAAFQWYGPHIDKKLVQHHCALVCVQPDATRTERDRVPRARVSAVHLTTLPLQLPAFVNSVFQEEHLVRLTLPVWSHQEIVATVRTQM